MPLTASLLDVRFLLLLVVIALLRWIVPARHYLGFGVIGSALAVAVAAPATFVTLAGITLGFLYPVHRLTCVARNHCWPRWIQSSLLPVAVTALVTLLLVSKLHRSFTLPWFGATRLGEELTALIGFSYFLFRAINYLHIQSILRLDEQRPWSLLFFTLFPATLTSGPIQKYQDFRLQLAMPALLDGATLGAAAYRITRGYFRKVVLAFLLNGWVTHLLAPPILTAPQSALLVVVLYVYFYFDFAGYSDIAIGLGLLMGIKVPENFRRPFAATTISEFWRNWHISLVDWFRDQIFIPLGGMRSSRVQAGALALLVMVLCGLWHGLTLPFVAWGLWHGFALLFEAITHTTPVPPARRHGPQYWARVTWTNLCVALPSILFLPNAADALRVLHGFTLWPHK